MIKQSGTVLVTVLKPLFAHILTNRRSSLIACVAKVPLSPLSPIRVAKNVALCMTTTCCLPPSPSILPPSLIEPAPVSLTRLLLFHKVVLYCLPSTTVQCDLTRPRWKQLRSSTASWCSGYPMAGPFPNVLSFFPSVTFCYIAHNSLLSACFILSSFPLFSIFLVFFSSALSPQSFCLSVQYAMLRGHHYWACIWVILI